VAEETVPLLDRMDDAAAELLKLINEPLGPTLTGPTVQEKTKLFEAVTEYIRWREKPTAPAQTKSKFERMKDEFNGRSDKVKGGGGAGRKSPADSANTTTAPPTPGDSGVN
jgi:hypothetical protein